MLINIFCLTGLNLLGHKFARSFQQVEGSRLEASKDDERYAGQYTSRDRVHLDKPFVEVETLNCPLTLGRKAPSLEIISGI